jgi:hypothetical protein
VEDIYGDFTNMDVEVVLCGFTPSGMGSPGSWRLKPTDQSTITRLLQDYTPAGEGEQQQQQQQQQQRARQAARVLAAAGAARERIADRGAEDEAEDEE